MPQTRARQRAGGRWLSERCWCVAAALALLLCVAPPRGEAKPLSLRVGLDKHQTLRSGLQWRDCTPSRIQTVTSTAQVMDLVAGAYKAAQQDQQRAAARQQGSLPEPKLLLRASSNNFVGHNNFTCADGAPEGTQVLVLDMAHLKQVVSISPDHVTVQAGMTFEDLEELLLAHNLSLPGVVITPTLSSMTIGAALATATHGSSLSGAASLAPFLLRATLVDGTGQIHVMEDNPGAMLEGSLGLLGIITEVTLEVVAAKKVAVKQLQEEDREMVGDLREVIENSEAVSLDVTWLPTAGLYTARIWFDAHPSARGDARNIFMHSKREALQATNRRLVQDQYDLRDEAGAMCEVLGQLTSLPHLSTSDGAAEGEGDAYGVSVGWVNRLAGARCPTGEGACLWQHAKWTPYGFSIDSEDFSEWLEDVRSIMSHAKGCPSFLFNFRFVMESEAPLAMHAGKQVVALEVATLSGLSTGMPIKHQGLFEEVVQMTLCKYQARPSWSFATNRMFLSPCPLRDTLGADWDAFEARRRQFDPAGLFVPPLWRQVERRAQGARYAGCAVAGDCFCQEDAHCGPRHKCVAGRVFKEYNVCVAEAWLRDGATGEL